MHTNPSVHMHAHMWRHSVDPRVVDYLSATPLGSLTFLVQYSSFYTHKHTHTHTHTHTHVLFHDVPLSSVVWIPVSVAYVPVTLSHPELARHAL